jgi:hypothetical protein
MITNGVTTLLADLLGRHTSAVHPEDVGVLQRFIQGYAKAGQVSVEIRMVLENALRSPSLKEWARGLSH